MKRLDPRARHSASIVLLLLLAVFLFAAWIAAGDALDALDEDVRTLVRKAGPEALDTPMWLISQLGSGWVLLPAVVVCSATLWWRRHRVLALWLSAASAATVFVPGLAKWLMNKPRPTLRGYGFPSGHVFGATVFVIVMLYLVWRFEAPRRWQLPARAAGLVFVTAVAYSRLYVNAHWLSDVVGGALAGVAFALTIVLALDARAR